MKAIPIIITMIILIWISAASAIQRFKCPAMTETQLLLNLPKAVAMDFECVSNSEAR